MRLKGKWPQFWKRAHNAVADKRSQQLLQNQGQRLDARRKRRWSEIQDIQQARQQARAARLDALRNLPELLEMLTDRITARGGHVYWAEDADAANTYILDVARFHGVQRVAKAKSLTIAEIGLNATLEAAGLQLLETDLGEYILQLAERPPMHRVAPAVPMRVAEISWLFQEKLGVPETYDINLLINAARSRIRRQLLQADMGITGANFAVAETGTLVMITNEGNGRFVNSLPPLHVAVVGVEKMVRSLDDLFLLLQLLPRSATGQVMTSYTSLYNGPARPGDADGPGEFHLVLLDNGRSQLLADGYGEILTCIGCGACLHACPIPQEASGKVGWKYPGPMGSVLIPLLQAAESSGSPSVSALNGVCRDACPVMIDLPRLLSRLRSEEALTRYSVLEQFGLHLWRDMISAPGRFWEAQQAGRVVSWLLGSGKTPSWFSWPFSRWAKKRRLPPTEPESFKRRRVEEHDGKQEEDTMRP